MAHFNSSNVIVQGGTFNLNSAQGDLTINNGDPEYGMHVSVLKRIIRLIDDPMKDFIPLN